MHRPPMERALGPMGEHGRWWNNPEMVEKLKLTDDQRKAMDQILLQHRETLIDMHGAVEKAELGMEPLMHADQPEEAKILAQIDKVAQARAELEKANARFLLALRAKLTPDQWKQLQTLKNEPTERREWRRDGSKHHHPGQMPAPPPQGAPAGGPQGMLREGPSPDLPEGAAPAPIAAENSAVK
jgi:Spy/CpxP family protein refolding chaperone